MKSIIICLILLCTSAFAKERQEVRQKIRSLADHIFDEARTTQAELQNLKRVEQYLTDSIAILKGEEVISYDRGECIKNILDRNYTPRTAKETCDTIETGPEYRCVVIALDDNNSPRRSVKACKGILASELDCFQGVLNRKFSIRKARELCISAA